MGNRWDRTERGRLRGAALTVVLAAGVLVGSGGGSAGPRAVAAEDPVGSMFTPVAPVRVLDTRSGTGGVTGPVGPGQTVALDLSSRVPASATAVVLNVTGTAPTSSTSVTVFPHGPPRPFTPNLNLAAAETRANLVTVQVGADRVVDLYNNRGRVQLLADLSGYYATGSGARFTPRVAERVGSVRVGAATSQPVDLSDRVPASATAVVLNVTAARPTASTYLRVQSRYRSTIATLNVAAGRTTPNLAIVALGADRTVYVYNNAGAVDVSVDLVGFYSADYGAVFTPVTPKRVFDTRNNIGTGGRTGPIGALETVDMAVGPDIPDDTIYALMNLTGTQATATTHVSAWQGPEMGTSNLNLVAGQTASNLAVIPIGGRRTTFTNNAGSVHVVADLEGYFWVPRVPCSTGCAYAWGKNYGGPGVLGPLGVGTTLTTTPTPAPVVGLSGLTDIADRYVLRSDGTVWSSGPNPNGELGAGWLGGESTVPVPVVGLTDVTAVAAGAETGWALRSDGTVWGWGRNSDGELGISGTSQTPEPVLLSLSGITAIAMGEHNGYALRDDGTVWALGMNDFGQLGNGSTEPTAWLPVQVSGLTDVTAIATNYKTAFALRADGTVWSWGWNLGGALGNGSTAEMSRVPVRVSGLTGIEDIAAGEANGYALEQDGTVWAWGDNFHGQLGIGQDCARNNGPICRSRVPLQASAPSGAATITATNRAAFVLDTAGRVWTWGSDMWDELGTGPGGSFSNLPVAVPGLDAAQAVYPGYWGGRAVLAS